MRVIAGSAKGRKLESVPGTSTRPITDRVKEALFNILGASIEGARFLDLFAGTGAVGIEALSRGAARAVFCERDRLALRTIGHNLQATGLADRARVVAGDAFRFLRNPGDERFDFVYIAPPQYKGIWIRALQAVDEGDVLAPGGIAIVQIHPKERQDVPLRRLRLFDERRYGSTLLLFYRLAEGKANQMEAAPAAEGQAG
ncbi:MAG: 16S rRNA (guanine(966)-N(2))-methyltransferase RsmD [Anaerolineae bacterium]|nr:16S rRNA (guanine(966)-N(2))-methyltransferase RsmD [Anaerolineae bacterium]